MHEHYTPDIWLLCFNCVESEVSKMKTSKTKTEDQHKNKDPYETQDPYENEDPHKSEDLKQKQIACECSHLSSLPTEMPSQLRAMRGGCIRWLEKEDPIDPELLSYLLTYLLAYLLTPYFYLEFIYFYEKAFPSLFPFFFSFLPFFL